jgi:hypothetical protein
MELRRREEGGISPRPWALGSDQTLTYIVDANGGIVAEGLFRTDAVLILEAVNPKVTSCTQTKTPPSSCTTP